MTSSKLYLLSCLAIGLLALGACSHQKKNAKPLPYFNQADFTPEWIKKDDPKLKNIHTIAPFKLINQDSQTVTNATFAGKIYVANFFFTTCGTVCPRMTENMHLVQEEFGGDDEVMMISHTVMPWVDSLPRLRKYVKRKDIDTDQWHLVTGKKEEIYKLARQSYFAEEKPGFTRGEEEFLHTEHLILVDKSGRIRGVYNGTLALEAKRLVEDIRTLKQEEG